MPLSDDELLGIERITTALKNYPEPEHGGVMVSKGIIDHDLGRVPELIAELRTARKVVEAAKVLGIERAEAWRMAQHPKISAPHTAAYLIIAEPLDELQAALAEYNLLNAPEPQPQEA